MHDPAPLSAAPADRITDAEAATIRASEDAVWATVALVPEDTKK